MNHLRNILNFGLPYLRRYWTRLAAGILLGVVFGLSNATFVWATKTLISRVAPAQEDTGTKKGKPRSEFRANLEAKAQGLVDRWLPRAGRPLDWSQIIGGLLFFPAFVALRGFTGYLSSYCLGWVSERAVNDVRLDVLRKVTSLSLDFFNRSKMGDLLTRVHGDTTALQRCLSLGFSDLIKEPITIVGLLAALFLIDAQLTLGAMVFMVVCIVPIVVLGRKVRKASKAGWNAAISQNSLLVEMLSGIRIVKAFNLEEQQVRRFQDYAGQLLRTAIRSMRAREQINPILETVAMFGLGALIIYIMANNRTVDDLVGYLTGLILFYTPVKKLGGIHLLFQQTGVGVERLVQIMKEQPSVKEHPSPKPLERFGHSVQFENVSFSYAKKPVLIDINLALSRGLNLGIAGESGSGKSTLVNLLFRFYDPTHGAIKFDGVDLREVRISDLRQMLALVSQDIVLFDLTVAENIALGKPGATRAEIELAARHAFAHEFIEHLPKKYDTRIGERGVTLSGGQRQRIAIARALIRGAPILVLDEATASLDSQSEAEVQAAIDRISEDHTVICVAHRLATLANMDQIIVLSQGRIIEQGGFEELLRRGGTFASMARRQGIFAGWEGNPPPQPFPAATV